MLSAAGPEECPEADGTAERLERHECSRLRAAAAHARRVFPGPVGEVLARELLGYEDFGYRGGGDALIPRLASQVLAMPSPRGVAGSDAA